MPASSRHLEQIRVDENRLGRFIDPVDLLQVFDIERIYAIDRESDAASINHDPLQGNGEPCVNRMSRMQINP